MKRLFLELSLSWLLGVTTWSMADDLLLTHRVYDVRQRSDQICP